MIRIAMAFCALMAVVQPAQATVEIQEVTSPGGIKAWLVEDHSIPFTALEIRFAGGAAMDPDGKRGTLYLTHGMLEEGAGDYDALGFARKTEELATSFTFEAYDDALSISARFLTENRDEAIELLRLALQEPSFDPVALERVRGQVLSIISSHEKDPDDMVGAKFDALAFPDHPYGTPLEGSRESVLSLTREDLVAAHGSAYVRDRVFVGATGDITPEELGEVLDTLLGALPAEGASLPGAADYSLSGGITVVPYDTPQSVVRFGHRGIKRDDPDFFPAYILNEILGGGGFGSRLTEEVRVKRGLTYGIATYLLPLDHAELYMGHFSSDNRRVAEAIDIIRAEWADVAENGVTEEELEKAKVYLTGAYPLRFDGNGRIANIMVGMQQDDLGLDYIPNRNDRVRAVTIEDIKRVAKRLLLPDELHFVVVGQPESLETTN